MLGAHKAGRRLKCDFLIAMKRILQSAIAAAFAGNTLICGVLAQSSPNPPGTPNPASAAAAGGPHQSTPGNFANGEVPDGIFRHLGETLLMKQGRAEVVKRELKMAGGITIEPNGTVTFKDGHKFKLKENQMATFDGQLKDVTPALTLPDNPTTPGRPQ
jgi:hypothetical protein